MLCEESSRDMDRDAIVERRQKSASGFETRFHKMPIDTPTGINPGANAENRLARK